MVVSTLGIFLVRDEVLPFTQHSQQNNAITLLHEKINPENWQVLRYCPLVIQGFSNFLRFFQVIMANPVTWFVFAFFNW